MTRDMTNDSFIHLFTYSLIHFYSFMVETLFLVKIYAICVDTYSVAIYLLSCFCSINGFKFRTSFVLANCRQSVTSWLGES